jgi:hypothetical protein
MKYVFVTFLPGAAGNFFSRCLNLLSGAYCWGQGNKLPVTLEEKLKILNYTPVLNRSCISDTWTTFESRLTPYYQIVEHHKLPPGSYAIWIDHAVTKSETLVGPDDQVFNFYIDPGDNFEWACMNAFFKNSYLDVKWIIAGKKLLGEPTVHKINLGAFLRDWPDFLTEFKKVTDIMGHTLIENEIQAIQILYNQWRTTILKPEDIKKFKNDIGFFM